MLQWIAAVCPKFVRCFAFPCLLALALILALGGSAMATDPTIPLPTIPTDTATDLTGWAVGMVGIGIKCVFIVANATVVIWFVRAVVRRIFGLA